MKEQNLEVGVERVGAMLPELVREGVGGRRATVLVQTDRHSYLGTLHVPDGKVRILDVLCDGRPFLNLTDVSTDGADGLEPLLVLNKGMIQCLRFVGVPTHPSGHSAFAEARRA
ncbi:MAG: hypothetical protein NDJ94_19375 [Vicinamibacteria bacterium]|jgi:hypothetical protein|nr:hypothetical protein [Vicinamibacteria bacterium]